ncbi:MAG: DUF1653 domain-containing protein [Eubacteriales bacterium]|nr:DUF1653 domain-containing protein [Eubacteriales bacterium]
MRDIRQGQFYRHFKGGLYQIVAVAKHSETGERMVVYQALYGDFGVYVRPYGMFAGEVDHEKYPSVTQRYRFELEEQRDTEEVKRWPEERQDTEEAGSGPEDGGIKDGPDKTGVKRPAEGTESPADGVNPILLEFLDADTLEEKLHILSYNRNRVDESLLNSIAISLDLVVEKKGLQEKFDEILNCLSMMKHFECNRLR